VLALPLMITCAAGVGQGVDSKRGRRQAVFEDFQVRPPAAAVGYWSAPAEQLTQAGCFSLAHGISSRK
jgi:hypothetical protein